MPTLYVRNFPEDLQERVKKRAKSRRRTFGAELAQLVDQALENEEIRSRRLQALEEADRLRERNPQPEGAKSTLDLLREDRER